MGTTPSKGILQKGPRHGPLMSNGNPVACVHICQVFWDLVASGSSPSFVVDVAG